MRAVGVFVQFPAALAPSSCTFGRIVIPVTCQLVMVAVATGFSRQVPPVIVTAGVVTYPSPGLVIADTRVPSALIVAVA